MASASHIFIYKNLRPYFKFTLPTLEILPAEAEIWSQAAAEQLEPGQVGSRLPGQKYQCTRCTSCCLTCGRRPGTPGSPPAPRCCTGWPVLSCTSCTVQRLLMLDSLPEVASFISTHRLFPLKKQAGS